MATSRRSDFDPAFGRRPGGGRFRRRAADQGKSIAKLRRIEVNRATYRVLPVSNIRTGLQNLVRRSVERRSPDAAGSCDFLAIDARVR